MLTRKNPRDDELDELDEDELDELDSEELLEDVLDRLEPRLDSLEVE